MYLVFMQPLYQCPVNSVDITENGICWSHLYLDVEQGVRIDSQPQGYLDIMSQSLLVSMLHGSPRAPENFIFYMI